EQRGAVGMTADVSADAAPEQQQRREALLVLGAYERATELDRGSEQLEEQLRVLEQCEAVEAGPAEAATDEVGAAEPVGADDLASLRVPDEKVLVVLIEGIEIRAAPAALPDRAEGELAQPPELEQRRRQRSRRCAIDAHRTGLEQQASGRQRCQLALQSARVDGLDERLERPARSAAPEGRLHRLTPQQVSREAQMGR